MFDTRKELQKAQNGVREATLDVIKEQGGRQGGVFWILHVDMEMGGKSAIWGQ